MCCRGRWSWSLARRSGPAGKLVNDSGDTVHDDDDNDDDDDDRDLVSDVDALVVVSGTELAEGDS